MAKGSKRPARKGTTKGGSNEMPMKTMPMHKDMPKEMPVSSMPRRSK